MIFFVDNENKDLLEVRDKDTGCLLGWMPFINDPNPILEFNMPSESRCAPIPETSHQMYNPDSSVIRKFVLHRKSFMMPRNLRVEYYMAKRSDWAKFNKEKRDAKRI